MARFEENHESLKFQDGEGNILDSVVLVIVSGDYDALKHRYVDKPQVVSGYGNVRPEAVAESVGIKFPR